MVHLVDIQWPLWVGSSLSEVYPLNGGFRPIAVIPQAQKSPQKRAFLSQRNVNAYNIKLSINATPINTQEIIKHLQC
jgi:hypothetical protein